MLKNAVFWDVAPCRSYVNRRFGRTYRLHLQGRKIRERGGCSHIPEDGNLHSHRRENLKSYIRFQVAKFKDSEASYAKYSGAIKGVEFVKPV
jgi:hypothetical protein